MLVWIAKYFYNFDIFSYLSFRAIFSLLTSLTISLCLIPIIISFQKKKIFLQVSHKKNTLGSNLKKQQTPIMGGIIILLSVIFSILLWTCLSNLCVWYTLVILVGYGTIGFIDDYRKIAYEGSNGLTAFWKYFWMSIVTLILIFFLFSFEKEIFSIKIMIPFYKGTIPDLKFLYFPLFYFVIIGSGNAVNLTDGLDGLAVIPIIFVLIGFSLIAGATSNINFSCYLGIPYLKCVEEVVVICMTIVGSTLGFLWFNAYPAQIFMGDTGSLALGGSLGVISILLCQEFLLLIMGGIFVIEALSVIVQVFYFKISRKRIFRMAPIHHHYELKGHLESHITVRFWIISLILVLIGLLDILKVR